MTKIQRRHTVVTLYQGQYEQQLTELRDQVAVAQTNEEAGADRRMASKGAGAKQLAERYDALREEAEAESVPVTLWALPHKDWQPLADEHPPRDGNEADKQVGVDLTTFPDALVVPCLASPESASTLAERNAEGQRVIDEIGGDDLSHVHWLKLQHAAWEVTTGDDDLPKYSLVSLLQSRANGSDSEPLQDGE